MKIVTLIENTSVCGLPIEHGLSLHLTTTRGERILFDMGQSDLLASNAKRLGVNLAEVDMAILSHGHYDHGGGMDTFLRLNDHAPIYLHRDAFHGHYSLRDTGMQYIGLDQHLKENPRLVYCEDITQISPHLTLFAGVEGNRFRPRGNRLLYGPTPDRNDTFTDEQNLLIEEGNETYLFAGCAHHGIVHILQRAEEVLGKTPTHVFGGMHLVKSGMNEAEENAYIDALAHMLKNYSHCTFHTMHCTGMDAYGKLQQLMGNQIEYLSCGDTFCETEEEERSKQTNPKI